jgi:hypothetical protein
MAFSYLFLSLSFATLAPSENTQANVDRSDCDKPGLRIVHASVFNGEGSIPIDPGDIREIKAAFDKSLVRFLSSHSSFTVIYIHT